ncbi:MAG: LacI family DNA-binding transcriptional regulator [Bacteroidota bacterium]|jgi:LacI family transcriptional regulator
MREKKTSLEDIAKAVGVSKATVSFVLNDRGDEFNISKEKQRIIKEKAIELAYVPNFFAKSLRQGQTRTIGLVLADISNPFYAELCKTIQEELYKRGYSTLIVNTNDNKELEKILMRELIQRSIDGMIISPCNTIDALIPILDDTHIPVVFADRPGDDHADFVGIDNTKEAQKLIRHFSVKPRRVVALTQHAERVDSIQNRIFGAEKACGAENIEFEAVHLPENEKDTNGIILSELKKGTDAFLPLNNPVALKLVAALKTNGINIPGQVRIISFDDHIAFDHMDPPISALKQPVYHIGLESVERLVDRLKETKVPGKHLLLSCEFKARGSH